LRTLLIEREAPGGQAGMSSKIENYLGFPAGLSGEELTRRALTQTSRFGAELLLPHEVTGISVEGPPAGFTWQMARSSLARPFCWPPGSPIAPSMCLAASGYRGQASITVGA
jgi:thioredoxin reductase